MAIDNPPGFLQNAGATHTAEQLRTFVGSLLAGLEGGPASVTRTRSGVQPALGGAFAVTQNGTPNMSVNVASGVAFVGTSESANQGMYAVRAPSTTNLVISASPGAGLNRIDLIVAKVQDTAYSGATDAWSLAVVTGTAAAGPSAPAAPNNSTILAQIFVGALVSSIVTGNITDKRTFIAATGASIPCTSITRPTTLYDGLGIFEYDTNLYSWTDGSTWFPQSQWVQGNNIWAIPSVGTNSFTSSSYVNLTLNSVVQTITLTKRYASTRMIIRFGCTGRLSTTQGTVVLGVSINGSDSDVRNCIVNTADLNNHMEFGGERWISGLAVGSTTFTARIKSSSGTWITDANDTFSFTVEEVQ